MPFAVQDLKTVWERVNGLDMTELQLVKCMNNFLTFGEN